MNLFFNVVLCLYVYVSRNVYASLSIPNIVEEEKRPALEGRICAYGDMDNDRYTDIIVQQDQTLVILSQSQQGFFEQSKKFGTISLGEVGDVYCNIGDFDGNTALDILVTHKSFDGYESLLFLYAFNNFIPNPINITFIDQPTVMDINGDGMSDIIGFFDKGLYCLAGNHGGLENFTNCSKRFINYPSKKQPYIGFAPIFADFTGDLGAEIVFGYQVDSLKLELNIWKLMNDNYEWKQLVSPSMPDNVNFQYFGSPVVSDFNADSMLDILIPICREKECFHVTYFAILSKNKWIYFQVDLKDSELVVDKNSKTLFRVGDFSLDGFPDLITTVKLNDKASPMILENVEYADNVNFNRKFELRTTPRLVMPLEMSKGSVLLSSFFDLKEDGNLDILVEYLSDADKNQKTNIDFIKCDDKGDTTFLKVQIFTNVCTNDCVFQSKKSSDIGSGVTWHGACVSFRMSDSWGGSRVSLQCQLPQTSHRSLHSPFALFGLGRSPNFVDVVNLGSPRWPEKADNHKHSLPPVVPNSRIIIVPPEGEGTHWQSRFYLTPNQLIFQSVLVLTSVCGILLLLIVILHFYERQVDRKERHSQTHRFHFDAM